MQLFYIRWIVLHESIKYCTNPNLRSYFYLKHEIDLNVYLRTSLRTMIYDRCLGNYDHTVDIFFTIDVRGNLGVASAYQLPHLPIENGEEPRVVRPWSDHPDRRSRPWYSGEQIQVLGSKAVIVCYKLQTRCLPQQVLPVVTWPCYKFTTYFWSWWKGWF